MGSNRDNFTPDTIRRAAGRVGYRCSFPNCPNTTIGASMENTRKMSITGVAAHICAAAEGGPRYDENMTADERKSVENCIWMCQTHAKLIDTDTSTYSAELLRKWKADAEKNASMALANGDYFSEYYKHNGDNLAVIEQLFDDMIISGQYDQLNIMLSQYKTPLSEQYEEFVLRYKIIYDVYCNRTELRHHLDLYCVLACKAGVDSLIELFLAFHLTEALEHIIEFCCSEPLVSYAKMAVSGELEKTIRVPIGSTARLDLPENIGVVISKYITNFIVQQKILGAADASGEKYVVFSEEFYYSAIAAAYELNYSMFYGTATLGDIVVEKNFTLLKNNIDKILLLDITLQEYIWVQILLFVSERPDDFDTYYQQCPLSLRSSLTIQRTKLYFDISTDITSVDLNCLKEYTSRSGDATLLDLYLSLINPDDAIRFLDEHGYLYRQDSVFLKRKFALLPDTPPEEKLTTLNRYRSVHENSFAFHLLLAKNCPLEQRANELNWMREHLTKMSDPDIEDYIRFLHANQYWSDLKSLSNERLPNELIFAIAHYLLESNDNDNIAHSLSLLRKLLDSGWNRRGLNFNLAAILKHRGRVEEAKKYFQKEYDQHHSKQALIELLQLRYDLNEFETDTYFEQLRRCIDAQSQNLVASIYMKQCNYYAARKYFLRSLLLQDTDNPSFNGFYLATTHLLQSRDSVTGANMFCKLTSEKSSLCVAIHDDDVLAGIDSPKRLANFMHFSAQDPIVAPLMFSCQGEKILWNGETYIIEEVLPVNDAIVRYFFSTAPEQQGMEALHFTDAEDLIAQMTTIMKAFSEARDAQIDAYNQLELHLPLSHFSDVMGESMLNTCEFLAFGNRAKIRNNLALLDSSEYKPIFILAYDAIVYLAHLGCDSSMLHDVSLACAPQVRNHLFNDINVELASLTNVNHKANMFYTAGRLSIVEQTSHARRDRYAILTKIKSLVASISVCSNMLDYSPNHETMREQIASILFENRLYCESGTLEAAKNTPHAILVTDDQFLYAVANTEGIPNVGLLGFFSNIDFDWSDLLKISKKLKEMNFANYLSLQFYKHIMDQMFKSGDDQKDASVEIQNWLKSDTGDAPTAYHEDLIISLCREVYNQGLSYLNPDGILGKIACAIYLNRNPGFFT